MPGKTVNVPLIGKANKGTVIGVTIGGFAVAGYLIYREVEKSKATTAASAAAQTATTGYGYGASGYGYATGYYGYGETMGYGASGGFEPGYYGYGVVEPQAVANATNAQWTQAALNQLTSEGYDATTVSAALGAYVEGQSVTAAQQTIIESAIGIEGYPPDPGANGYPPSINTSGAATTGGGQTSGSGPWSPGGKYVTAAGQPRPDIAKLKLTAADVKPGGPYVTAAGDARPDLTALMKKAGLG